MNRKGEIRTRDELVKLPSTDFGSGVFQDNYMKKLKDLNEF